MNIGGSGNHTMNEDGYITFSDGLSIKEVNKTKDYIEIEEKATIHCTSRVEEFKDDRWVKEDCQIITHHSDGKEEIINVQ